APPPPTLPLPLHDALPILDAAILDFRQALAALIERHAHVAGRCPLPDIPCDVRHAVGVLAKRAFGFREGIRLAAQVCLPRVTRQDRKSTRLNSSHVKISYA